MSFDGSEAKPAIASTDLPLGSLAFDESKSLWMARVEQSGKYFAVTSKGRQEFEVKAPAPRISVAGPWSLVMDSVHPSATLDTLKSWTEIPPFNFHSGQGTYGAEVDIPTEAVGQDCGLWLDLGEVREIAEVRVNENAAGVVWKLPYRLDITRWARSGKNRITVTVTNLPINRMLGEPDPDFSGLPHPLRFPLPEEKGMVPSPLPSGLLGPVDIVPYRRVAVI